MTASLYQSGSEVFGTAVIELLIRGSAASLPCSCARGRSAHVVLASVMMFHAKDVAWLATGDDRKHEPSEVYRIPLYDPSQRSPTTSVTFLRNVPALMSFPRASGVLLHPTSLPGRYGIGDLGPAAFEFIDLLASGRQRIW